MVRNVTENVTIEAVKSHFQEAFGFAPNDVQITFDETELLQVQELLRDHETALSYLQVNTVDIFFVPTEIKCFVSIFDIPSSILT